jgi:tetratricopeptide (TPR) repeat protein
MRNLKTLLFIFLTIQCGLINAQEKNIVKALELIADSKNDEALQKIEQYKKDSGEDAFYCYGMALLKKSKSSTLIELESAYQFIERSNKYYLTADEDLKRSFCKKANICGDALKELRNEIISNIWTFVKNTNNLSEYDAFISKYNEFAGRDAIVDQRDLFAYELIKDSGKMEDFQKYLKTYPNSKINTQVEAQLESLYYEDAIRKNSRESLSSFIELYPNSKNSTEVRSRLVDLDWRLVSGSADLAAFKAFGLKHPTSRYYKQSLDSIVRLEWLPISKSEDIALLQSFANKHSNYPEANLANQRIKYLQSFSIPYAMRNRKYSFYSVVDKKVSNSGQYDEINLLSNGAYLVSNNKKYGVANRRGEIIVPSIYSCVSNAGDYYIARNPGYFLIYDSEGKEVATFKNGLVKASSNFLLVSDKIAGKQKTGLYDFNGNMILPIKYDYIIVYNTFVLASSNNLINCFSLDGKQLSAAYSSMSYLSDKWITFVKDDKIGIMDMDGRVVLQPKYNYLSMGGQDEFIVTTSANTKTIINSDGYEMIVPGDYFNISHVTGSIYTVQLTYPDQLLYDAKSRRYLTDDRFQSVGRISENGLYALSKNNVHIYDLKGELKNKYPIRPVKEIDSDENYDHGDEPIEDGSYYDGEEGYVDDYDPFLDVCSELYPSMAQPKSGFEGINSKFTSVCNENQCVLIDNSNFKLVSTLNGYNINLLTDKYLGLAQTINDQYSFGIFDYYGKAIKTNCYYKSTFTDGTVVVGSGSAPNELILIRPDGTQVKLLKDITDVQEYENYFRMSFRDIFVYAPKSGNWLKDTMLYDPNMDFNDFNVSQKKGEANSFFYEGKYAEAIKLFEDAFLLKPTDHEISQSISRCYLKMGRTYDAFTWINKAIESSPKNVSFLQTRIDIYKESGDNYNLGLEYRNLGKVATYSNEVYYSNSSYHFLEGGYYNEAINSATTGIARSKAVKDDNLSYLYNIRGIAYDRSNRKSEALEDYLSAIKYCPTYSTSNMGQFCYNVAVTYSNQNKWSLACPYYKKACTNDNKFCNYYYQCR